MWTRPINPFDVNQDAFYVEDRWREPFARLRAEMPLSWRSENPFGPYWLGGQTIRKGEKVVMWYISANRYESVFPDAERFDVGRENARRHLAFGHGIHRCVGARLAENRIATLIAEIARRNIRIAANCSPVALALTRRMLWQFSAQDSPAGALAVDAPLNIALGQMGDVHEGVAAFLEKRAPQFPLRLPRTCLKPPGFTRADTVRAEAASLGFAGLGHPVVPAEPVAQS